MDYAIRPARPSDIPGIKSVTQDADVFPPDMLDAMIAGYMGRRDVSRLPPVTRCSCP